MSDDLDLLKAIKVMESGKIVISSADVKYKMFDGKIYQLADHTNNTLEPLLSIVGLSKLTFKLFDREETLSDEIVQRDCGGINESVLSVEAVKRFLDKFKSVIKNSNLESDNDNVYVIDCLDKLLGDKLR